MERADNQDRRRDRRRRLGLAGLCALAVAGLGEAARRGWLDRADEAALVWLAARRTPGWEHFFRGVTALGTYEVLVVLALGAAVALAIARRGRTAAAIVVVALGGAAWSSGLKRLYDRARPKVVAALSGADPWSFPSGHAIAAAVFFTMLALVVTALGAGRGVRRFVTGYAAAGVALVALSRLYLGVHYPSDVIAGACVGAGWSLLVAAVAGMGTRKG